MESHIFHLSNPYPTHYRLDVPAAVNNAQETNVHFNLQNITVLWNVTPCTLVSIYQATSQKTVVFPFTIVWNPDFTYTIHHCCNFMFALKLENKAIAFVFLSVSVLWMYERTVRVMTAGSATRDIRTGRIRLYSHFLLPRTPYLSWEISIYEPTPETIRTVEISRLI
jgi:hypothetical protein